MLVWLLLPTAVPFAALKAPTLVVPGHLQSAVPESSAIRRMYSAGSSKLRKKPVHKLRGRTVEYRVSSKGIELGGKRYVETPNSTMVQTVNPKTGQARIFLLTRGVRPYTSRVNLEDGSHALDGYVSDVLLFEKVGRRLVFRKRILTSSPKENRYFEDPRVSVLHDEDGSGRSHLFLSITEVNRGNGKDLVVNKLTELLLDEEGVPKVIDLRRDPFRNLSPPPVDGEPVAEGKNGTIARDEKGKIVVRTRIRPAGAGALGGYAEQVFSFPNLQALFLYDWKDALKDLAGGDAPVENRGVLAKTLIHHDELPELFDDPRVDPTRPKGFGPGTPPVRLRRAHGHLWLSEGKGAPEHDLGPIPDEVAARFPIAEGEVKYLTFDHEMRYFRDLKPPTLKRNYTASAKLFDATLTHLELYYADIIQPKRHDERGVYSGVRDLEAIYPTGRLIVTNKKGKPTLLLSAGVGDSHTRFYAVDVMKLLIEMSEGSSRWANKQVRRHVSMIPATQSP